MSTAMAQDLLDQFRRTFGMLTETIQRFDDDQWRKGLTEFQVPVKVAMHTLDCLDFYFLGIPGEQYRWGHRFGGGWWELSEAQLPSREAVLEYARELEDRVARDLSGRSDEDLALPYPVGEGQGDTYLGHYVYALRHTMHHHGALTLLSVYHGNKGGSWK